MLKSNFDQWFPSYKRVNGHLFNSGNRSEPVCRILCIHGAGGSDQIFLKKDINSGADPPNILLDYIRENGIELLALQLPGRAERSREPCYKDIHTLINDLYPTFKKHFFGETSLMESIESVPWILVGHSMGGLIGFELLKRLKLEFMEYFVKNGEVDQESLKSKMLQQLRSKRIFPELFMMMSTFPPNVPIDQRPWRKNEWLNDEEFKQECREWGINEKVFRNGIWEEFERQLRCDFSMFDTFEIDSVDKKLFGTKQLPYNCMYPLGVKTQLWCASQDRKVTMNAIVRWEELLTTKREPLDLQEIDAPHNFLHDPTTRREWMQRLTKSLDIIILDLEYL
ncbi:thioesterase [Cryptosporidium canis]|uniref:Thioesterase n=1 Tax=Cryptosporidium canis TaxID=195482 RepID=A0ABQ8PCJ9_9CRYT|nr:thioesterase [Cryptosporidium canis]KAJ1615511.1 thioesterase [Cryptosporidium canis]